MEIAKVVKSRKNLYCEYCDYKCYRTNDYKKHLLTEKHKVSKVGNQPETTEIAKVAILPEQKDMKCECGKSYKNKSGLWKHKKKCKIAEEIQKNTEENIVITEENAKNAKENITIEITEKKPENPPPISESLIIEFIKQNQELQKQLLEVIKNNIGTNTTNNTTNNNNTNCNNNNFNLNFFLNETCKDASNITDFVNGIQLSLEDFARFGTLGYAGSISNVFVRELKALDVTKRPIHCSDLKRDVLHIKDSNNTWVKDEDKKLMKKAILSIEHKNIQLIPEYAKAYPEVNDSTNKRSDEYDKMMYNAMGEYKDEDNERNYNKITHNVAKVTVIDKDKKY